MSTDSKLRRDARKRAAERQRNQAAANPAPVSPIEPHAELRDQQRTLLAGIVRRDGEWVLGMDGRIAGESTSAAQVLALIMRAAELHERQGTPVRLTYSDALKDAAHAEARADGMEFEQFKTKLSERLQGAPSSIELVAEVR
ncbi:hypothetical protein [Xanthomonas oryzae]|uniref:hypothetical protein n=2 Tax=Xanthomonas TaxID=338 RepID=UPI00104F7502|nr:hypothetical protein [Xanthomonas oryzae]QBG91195.1 hypothetical protein EYR26_05695 [Xanthomonas oryzae]QRN42749.1 hypothetical protein GDR29_16550 [Xanthomonas oryzae pv. oryzae]